MKVANIEFTKEKLYMLAGAGALIAAIAIYAILYAPLISQLGARHSECRAAEAEVIAARDLIESSGRIYGDKVLMTEKETSLAIDELTRHGKAMGVNFISIRPKDVITDKALQYKILPVGMEIECTDAQCGNFMGALDELKKSIITVRSFRITPDKEDRSRLRMDIVVNAYFSASDNK